MENNIPKRNNVSCIKPDTDALKPIYGWNIISLGVSIGDTFFSKMFFIVIKSNPNPNMKNGKSKYCSILKVG